MEINLGTVKMPINAATKSFAILAKRGAGKTYLGGVMAEEFFKNNIPFVVFDPIDVWWGLRLSADGNEKGLPIVVFGLEHADIQLDREMGRRIAQAVVNENISCVISTFGMPKAGARHLIAEFAEELLNANNAPRHVFIEEAHEYVPQRVMGAQAKTFAAVESLVTMGRNRGVGVTMLNQRAATINKDVLTQLDTLLALRSVGPQDRKALAEWVEEQEAQGDFDRFIASLATLPTGEGWVWSPEFLGVFEKFKIRKRETLHPDREKIGNKFVMPQLDQIDIQNFISKFCSEAAVAKSKPKDTANHPAQPRLLPAPVAAPVEQQMIRDLKNSYESRLMEKDVEIRRLIGIIETARRAALGQGGNVISSAQVSIPAIELWKSKLGNGLANRLLTFFAENAGRGFTKEQAALAVGVPARAGHTRNEFGKLMRTGTIIRNGDVYRLNPSL